MRDPVTTDFAELGYCIVPASDPEVLDQLRTMARDTCFELLGLPRDAVSDDVSDDLDHLHRHLPDADAAARLRLDLTRSLGERTSVGRSVFAAFAHWIRPLVGNDVLSQRVANVVLQPPGDPHPTVLHRDAPANSPYEVIAWVPLVDCRATKSMYLLDRANSATVLAFHQRHPDDSHGLQQRLDDYSEFVEVRFGEALLFWSGLFHGSVVNAESTTRLSLNTRFKSLFAPLGMKDPFRYFEVIETTPLTRLGLTFQRDEG
jgi:sporadic carbohydrate cluster 2OG-Fe(II) oxygenase